MNDLAIFKSSPVTNVQLTARSADGGIKSPTSQLLLFLFILFPHPLPVKAGPHNVLFIYITHSLDAKAARKRTKAWEVYFIDAFWLFDLRISMVFSDWNPMMTSLRDSTRGAPHLACHHLTLHLILSAENCGPLPRYHARNSYLVIQKSILLDGRPPPLLLYTKTYRHQYRA